MRLAHALTGTTWLPGDADIEDAMRQRSTGLKPRRKWKPQRMTVAQWTEQCFGVEAGQTGFARLQGPSPGAAAATLNVSRQRITELCETGFLERLEIVDDATGEVRWISITLRSLAQEVRHRRVVAALATIQSRHRD